MSGMSKAVLLMTTLSAIACTQEKDRLDAEVRRLCALDGGVKVYEKIELLAERFGKHGMVVVPERKKATPTDEYVYEVRQKILVSGNPEMWKWHAILMRQRDQKVLGESISYTRRGGDLPGPWHPSQFTCPEGAGIVAVKRGVFTRGIQENSQ